LFLRQLEYISQDIRKHRKAQGAGESSDLEIHAKIDWLNYVYGCPEELYRTIQYDTTDNRGYDFSTRKNVTAQLYPFKLENLQGEHSYGADRFILSTQSISPLLNLFPLAVNTSFKLQRYLSSKIYEIKLFLRSNQTLAEQLLRQTFQMSTL